MEATGERPPCGRWLSRGLQALVHGGHDNSVAVDLLIGGSGYGGAITAVELARCADPVNRPRMVMLERGNEYLPGSFPAHESELPGHVRFSTASSATPRGNRDALFDMRIGPDVCALLANGL